MVTPNLSEVLFFYNNFNELALEILVQVRYNIGGAKHTDRLVNIITMRFECCYIRIDLFRLLATTLYKAVSKTMKLHNFIDGI